ncbi:MAG: 3-deoxy-8-phosphooctulonate synthase [Thermodesulfobacteria bacterium]|nr:3-deoxy-8-phosphooctulonate synthase [Thermodesulfobacteriota bacterium]
MTKNPKDNPKVITLGDATVGPGAPPLLIAGPCVLENVELALEIGSFMKAAAQKHGFTYMFKGSFDKANRTSISSFRGPGLDKGLEILSKVRERLGCLVTTDIHLPEQAEPVSQVVDCLQIPAFLSRQTDILVAAAKTGKVVNIKKGQFLAPWDMAHALGKVKESGNDNILLTERGACFGYNNLVVDMRSLPIMRSLGFPVIFDATHSVQLPGGGQGCSGGQREFVPYLARAAVACGCDGVFMEVYPEPERARCDGANSLSLKDADDLLGELHRLFEVVADVI